MNTAATVFFLILGQANGYGGTNIAGAGGGLAVIPADYPNVAECIFAGEEARQNNDGLSFLSYTCVPAKRIAVQDAEVAAGAALLKEGARNALKAVKVDITHSQFYRDAVAYASAR